MTLNEALMILATFGGPIMAVQAQKWLERARSKQGRREWIFDTLMATRGARMGFEHVRALNAIDLAFSDRELGMGVKRDHAQAVVAAWHTYHAHLSKQGDWSDPKKLEGWGAAGEELFLNLLEALAKATGHEFTREQLKTGGYSPVGHGMIEQEAQAIRRGAISVLAGIQPLKVEPVTPPPITVQPVKVDERQGPPLQPAPAGSDGKA